MSKTRIAHISIKNILGITDLEFSPEGFTVIEGPNGTGKTSVLEAIKSVARGGHDATLLRNGAEKGEIVFVLDDGMEIRKRVSKSASTTDVLVNGKKESRPIEAIKALTDMLSVNPIDFLLAKKADRVRVLLESMPIELDKEELEDIAGITVNATPGLHALSVIEMVRQQVYDDRTGTNRAVKEKESTINQLRMAMPDAVDGVTGTEDELQAKIDAAAAARDDTFRKIGTKLGGIKANAQESIDAIRTKLQSDIDALKGAAQAQVDAINGDTAENQTKASAAENNANLKYLEVVGPLKTAIDAIKLNRNTAAKREQALETIKKMESDLENLVVDADKQTKAISAIDRYKCDLLATLPIPGIEVRDGDLYFNDVIFDRINDAQKIGIAFEIAKLRAGTLGIICVNGVEQLDESSLDALRQNALDSNFQLFVTKVSDNEFNIDTTSE